MLKNKEITNSMQAVISYSHKLSQDNLNSIQKCLFTPINGVTSIIMLTLLLLISTARLHAQSNDDCLMCHSDNTLTMEKNGKEISLYVDAKIIGHSAHKNLACISCHVGFDIDNIPHKENIKPINCESCHKDAALKHPFHPQMLEANGVDGGKDVNCKGCHGTHDVISPEVPGSKFSKSNIINACGTCHKEEKEKYIYSSHYLGLKEGITSAPNCITCHKNSIVGVSAHSDSTKIKITQEKLCLSCHLDNPQVRGRTVPSAGFIKAYENSIHGQLLKSGNEKAANCVNCHTAHSIKDPNDPTSTVNKFNIPKTCSQCHPKIEKVYAQSIHGVAVLQKGDRDAPVCTDCHGEHNILNPQNPKAPTSYANLSAEVCSPCHSSVKLSQKYGLKPNRQTTFNNSYHGLALEGGSTIVANCASCHGVHNIKPASDPTSTINKANLAKTCGKCHPGANEKFAVGKIHVSLQKPDEPILHWIVGIYIMIIVLTIGSMFLHNVFDFIKKAKVKRLKQEGRIKEEHYHHSLYMRMNVNERFQHGLLAVSFIILVITGFMLQFPEAWWVVYLRSLWKDVFELRSLLHRIAGVLLITVSLYHIYYISATKRGRKLIKDLFPVYRDITDAIGVAKYNMGISNVKPKLDRFSYIEKAEYWALIWGTIVMSATGIIMWFDNTFIGLFTKLGWDIARTIHYYEAWLATLAIIVWHFYFVIFSPDVYPMNLAWLKGTLTEEEMAEEHPAELERIKEQQYAHEKDDSLEENKD